MVFATNGIITRVYDVGASDKMLHMITSDHGRIAVMVKGGRSPSSKLRAVSQLFTYGNFEISQKGTLYWLRSGEILNPFYDISTDVVRVALAVYLCDLANELTGEVAGEVIKLPFLSSTSQSKQNSAAPFNRG